MSVSIFPSTTETDLLRSALAAWRVTTSFARVCRVDGRAPKMVQAYAATPTEADYRRCEHARAVLQFTAQCPTEASRISHEA